MKKLSWPLVALVVICLVAYACKKNQETKPSAELQLIKTTSPTSETLTPQTVFTKNAGRPVARDTCMQWIGNYQKQGLVTPGNKCTLSALDLANLLKAKDAVGIIFYNGYDKVKGMVLMPFAVASSGRVLKTKEVYSSIGKISWDKAVELKKAFKQSAVSALEAEYFGANTFERLITVGKATTIQIRRGWNDKGECLILSDADQPNSITFEEDGAHCPPFCRDGDGSGF